MIHELKIAPEYFQEVFLGHKNFEIRKNDRGFSVGDVVILNECDVLATTTAWATGSHTEKKVTYTGRKLARKITYITDYMQQDGYVVFGME